jgi:hypothetical protein
MPPRVRASGPGMLHYILGITKAYTTRVGSGPFPTELDMGRRRHGGPPPVDGGPGARHRHRPRAAAAGWTPQRSEALDDHQRHLGPVHHQARRAGRLPEIKVCVGYRCTARPSTSCRWTPTTSPPASRSTRPAGLDRHHGRLTELGCSCRPMRAPTCERVQPDRRADRHGVHRPRPRPHHPAAPPLPGLIPDPHRCHHEEIACSPTTASTCTCPGTSTTC